MTTTDWHWHTDSDAVFEFACILHTADYFTTPGEVLDYFEKPRKWTTERDKWIAAGRPTESSDAWGPFLAAMLGD